MPVGSFVKEVLIEGVEKRRQPSKHYVYRIKVSWSGSVSCHGKIQIIYRRYSQFFSFQDNIFNTYPEESGVNNPADRIVPLLPGKIIFGRSQIREVAVKRKELINEYLQKLIKLPEQISRCSLLLDFLTVTKEDVNDASRSLEKSTVKSADNISEPIALEQYMVVANFQTVDRNQVSLACGDTVGVIEKHDNGWWFVCIEDQQGWVPSSYLEPLNKEREDEKGVVVTQVEMYICIKEYAADQHDELTLKLGDIVTLQLKQRDGWWKVKLHSDSSVQKEGYVPAVYLAPKKCAEALSATVEELSNYAGKVAAKEKDVKAPPRQNTVKKVKRRKPQRPNQLQGLKEQPPTNAHANDLHGEEDEEEVVYICGQDYHEVDTNGTLLNIKEGTELQVLEKTPNGWWNVKAGTQEGWIPSNYAQRKRRLKSDKQVGDAAVAKKTTELFTTISSHTSNEESGLSFEPGQIVELLEKDPSGWWFVKLNEQEGWAPSNFLKKHHPPKNTPVETLQNVKIQSSHSISISDKYYENVCVPEQSAQAEKTTPLGGGGGGGGATKPPFAPKPKVREKPTVGPPKPVPRIRASTDTVNSVNRTRPTAEIGKDSVNMVKIKQKPGRASSSSVSSVNRSSYDQVPARPREDTNYCNMDFERNDDGDGDEAKGETYVALADYTDTDTDMLSIKAGQLLLVTTKVDNGWWYAELGDEVGWVPSNYLRKN